MNSTVVKVLLIIVLVLAAVALLVYLGALDVSFGGDSDTPDALSALTAV